MDDKEYQTENVVLVHGLWMPGSEMWLLRRRLRRAGYRVYQFRYRMVARSFAHNVQRLNDYVAAIDGAVVHFVCHSLGGLLVRRLYADFPSQREGRIVTLGTPHQGSFAARQLGQVAITRHMLGESLPPLSATPPPWQGQAELGVIAGSRAFGLGRLVPGLPRPSDGTVSVAESRLAGSADYRLYDTTHFGLLFSAEVARQVDHFLRHGRFSPATDRPAAGDAGLQ